MWLTVAGVNGFIAVAAGALGAHLLKSRLSAEALEWFHTGAEYHIYHALALAIVALVVRQEPGRAVSVAGWAFLAGIVLFSGSLYALALTEVRWLAHITPFGGLAFLLGWLALGLAGFRGRGSRA